MRQHGKQDMTPTEADAHSRLTMTKLPVTARPYERIYRDGPASAGDHELLAVLIQGGTKQQTALDLAHHLLSDTYFPTLKRLGDAGLEELQTVPGIGPVKALRIASALELGARMARQSGPARERCQAPAACARAFIPVIGDKDREVFAVLFLTRSFGLIRVKILSEGALARTVIESREIFREALKANAHAVVLGHNHPSGHLEPSLSDLRSTEVLIRAGKFIGIPVVDHLIVSGDRWLSLRESTRLFDTAQDKGDS